MYIGGIRNERRAVFENFLLDIFPSYGITPGMKCPIYIFFNILFFFSFGAFVPENSSAGSRQNYGIILGDVVNVRSQSDAGSAIVDTVKENEKVIIIEWTAKHQKIGKFEDKWVKVKTPRGKEGYLFGAFLFDLNALTKDGWKKMVDSRTNITGGTGDTFHFKPGGTITIESVRNYRFVFEENGSYQINGRKISIHLTKSLSYVIKDPPLDQTRLNVQSGAINKTLTLYLFKLNGVHFLVNSPINMSYSLPAYEYLRFASPVTHDFYKQ